MEIRTENLILQDINLDYAQDIFCEFTEEITRYMYPSPPEKIEDTLFFINKSIEGIKQLKEYQLVILSKESREFLGCCGIHEIDTPTPELGVWLKKSAHGHSYGLEAMTALKEWADHNLDYEYIKYPVVPENYPSRRIPERLGGVVADEYDKLTDSGEKHHLVEYRIFFK